MMQLLWGISFGVPQVLSKIANVSCNISQNGINVGVPSFRVEDSIISYGIIFWGGSSYANKVFILQKKIIRIITNIRPRDSCRRIFKNMEIMTLNSFYTQLIINICLAPIMRFIIIKLDPTIIYTYLQWYLDILLLYSRQ
jgi:hypothetical protein